MVKILFSIKSLPEQVVVYMVELGLVVFKNLTTQKPDQTIMFKKFPDKMFEKMYFSVYSALLLFGSTRSAPNLAPGLDTNCEGMGNLVRRRPAWDFFRLNSCWQWVLMEQYGKSWIP